MLTRIMCAVCKSPDESTQQYTVRRGSDKPQRVDLCADDAAPLEDVLTYADQPADDETPPKGSPKRKRKVVTLAEIEELKKAEGGGVD
ncbi:hypothetical protein [Streptomyces sp. DT117]|uniref:hypothetical protein n=1 Tax=Streptomyces sp. DT117 TaxID=3393422 RepID=UPI003CE744DE